ncbi:hypothetical protein MASR2M47_47540 [Draconibacterium sp.]
MESKQKLVYLVMKHPSNKFNKQRKCLRAKPSYNPTTQWLQITQNTNHTIIEKLRFSFFGLEIIKIIIVTKLDRL